MNRPRSRSAAGRAGQHVERSRGFAALVTVGLLSYGVVHLLVAWIAVQLAWTGSNQQASQKGAFQQLASTSIGEVLLWITAVGLFALALWQGFQAIWGHRDVGKRRDRVVKRLQSAARAIIYLALGVSAASTAAGTSSSTSSNTSEKTLTAQLMSVRFGRIAVIVIGVVVIAIGGRLVYQGVKNKFTEDLTGKVSAGLIRLGVLGYTAKGVALAIVGVLFVVAAVTFRPQEAGGLDSALRALRNQTFGPILLTLLALGIACFGLYCFGWSRHAKKR